MKNDFNYTDVAYYYPLLLWTFYFQQYINNNISVICTSMTVVFSL